MLAIPWPPPNQQQCGKTSNSEPNAPYMYALPAQSVSSLLHPRRYDARRRQDARHVSHVSEFDSDGVAAVMQQKSPDDKPRKKVADRWQSEYRFQYLKVQPKVPYAGCEAIPGATALDCNDVVEAVHGVRNRPCEQDWEYDQYQQQCAPDEYHQNPPQCQQQQQYQQQQYQQSQQQYQQSQQQYQQSAPQQQQSAPQQQQQQQQYQQQQQQQQQSAPQQQQQRPGTAPRRNSSQKKQQQQRRNSAVTKTKRQPKQCAAPRQQQQPPVTGAPAASSLEWPKQQHMHSNAPGCSSLPVQSWQSAYDSTSGYHETSPRNHHSGNSGCEDQNDVRYLALAGHVCKENSVNCEHPPDVQGFMQAECQKCGSMPVSEDELFVPFEPTNYIERNPKFFKYLPPTMMDYIPPAGKAVRKGIPASACLDVYD